MTLRDLSIVLKIEVTDGRIQFLGERGMPPSWLRTAFWEVTVVGRDGRGSRRPVSLDLIFLGRHPKNSCPALPVNPEPLISGMVS